MQTPFYRLPPQNIVYIGFLPISGVRTSHSKNNLPDSNTPNIPEVPFYVPAL
jgi:hypothetical protein